MTVPTLRDLLSSDGVVYCAWCVLPQPMGAEMLARQGWDCVLIDGQHGFIDYADMLAMVVAVQGAGKPALVRPPLSDEGFIGKALDAGADGIVCPMINSGRDAGWLARAGNYPPVGARSWGPLRAVDRFGIGKDGFHEQGNALTEIWAMVETQDALDNLEDILAPDGINGVFVGPNDLSNSLTSGGELDPGHPRILQALETVLAAAGNHGKFAGVYANTVEFARIYADLGFRFIAVGSDASFLKKASLETLKAVRGGN